MLADIEPVGVFILTFAGTREFTAPDSTAAENGSNAMAAIV